MDSFQKVCQVLENLTKTKNQEGFFRRKSRIQQGCHKLFKQLYNPLLAVFKQLYNPLLAGFSTSQLLIRNRAGATDGRYRDTMIQTILPADLLLALLSIALSIYLSIYLFSFFKLIDKSRRSSEPTESNKGHDWIITII